MKIDGNRLNLDPAALQRLERAATDAPKPASTTKAAAGAGDTVQVSADAALANEAVKAVNKAPDVRMELVERMRALLAAGELGSDSVALADSLIDGMTDQSRGPDRIGKS